MDVENDDMIMIVVDEDNSEAYPDLPLDVIIKEEMPDIDDEQLQQLIDFAEGSGIIKKDSSDVEYLEDERHSYTSHGEDNGEDEWQPDKSQCEEYSDEYDNNSDDNNKSVKMSSNARRRNWRIKDPSLWISYVDQICNDNPDLREDQNALVQALVTMMKAVKPPPLTDHYKILPKGEYQCAECKFISNSGPVLERHYYAQHGPRFYICFACGADFRSTTNLYKHEKRCLAPDAPVVLRARAIFVGGKARGRPFIPQQPIKNKHDVDHRPKEKKFGCSLCSASFRYKTSLVSHERMHRAERPFKCDLCPRTYTSKSVLSKHLWTHSDACFMCDFCGRTFKYKTALQSHLYTHSDVPRFPCSECPRRFTYKAALQLHVHRKHRLLPSPCACQICPKQFSRMWALKDHMKKAHGMLLMTRTMFFKQLPLMSQTELSQAKVVLRSDVPLLYPSDINIDDTGPYMEPWH